MAYLPGSESGDSRFESEVGQSRLCPNADMDTAADIGIEDSAVFEGEEFAAASIRAQAVEE